MVCRPWDAAESDMAKASENEMGTSMSHLGGAGESKDQVRVRATRWTTPGTGRRRSAPPRRGWD